MALDPTTQPVYNYTPTTTSPFGTGTSTPGTFGKGLPSGSSMVQASLEAMLGPNSQYVQNARREGARMAAARGGINSSIAAGAAERAAVDAAAPLAQQALAVDLNRENINAEEWAASQNFNREIMGQYAMLPFQSSLQMLDRINQYALQDPALYTPEVTSGLSNFFSENMNNVLKSYFRR